MRRCETRRVQGHRFPRASRRARPGLAGLGRGLEPRRRDGRSPSRRTGGPAPKRSQRRPRRPPVTARTQRRNRRPRRVVTGARRDGVAEIMKAADNPFADWQTVERSRIAAQGRDAPVTGSPWPSRTGLLDGRDPVAAGRMGLSGSILPGADRGMAERGVSPIHVQGARIGIGAPLAVAQPKARQRLGRLGPCPAERRFRVRPPPKCAGQLWIATESVENRPGTVAGPIATNPGPEPVPSPATGGVGFTPPALPLRRSCGPSPRGIE